MSKKRKAASAAEIKALRVKASRRLSIEQMNVLLKYELPEDVVAMIEEFVPLPSSASTIVGQIVRGMRTATKAGFAMAVERYGMELIRNKEAMRILASLDGAGEKGRKTQISTKEDNARKAKSMFAQGVDIAEIAREIGRSIPTVYRLLNEDTSGKPAKRKRPRRR